LSVPEDRQRIKRQRTDRSNAFSKSSSGAFAAPLLVADQHPADVKTPLRREERKLEARVIDAVSLDIGRTRGWLAA